MMNAQTGFSRLTPRQRLMLALLAWITFMLLACDDDPYAKVPATRVPPPPPTVSPADSQLHRSYNNPTPVPTLGTYPCDSAIAGCR